MMKRVARRWLSSSPGGGKRPTTPLGMLAWDAREEAARRAAGDDGRTVDAAEAFESVMERVANRKIREAMEGGDFDSALKDGHGKPLPRDEATAAAAFTSQSQAMLNKVLANNNITPEFITLGKAIREDLNALENEMGSMNAETRKQRVLRINARIRSFNKINRIPSMHIAPLDENYKGVL